MKDWPGLDRTKTRKIYQDLTNIRNNTYMPGQDNKWKDLFFKNQPDKN